MTDIYIYYDVDNHLKPGAKVRGAANGAGGGGGGEGGGVARGARDPHFGPT